jgi:lysophospholipase L1-like esterase
MMSHRKRITKRRPRLGPAAAVAAAIAVLVVGAASASASVSSREKPPGPALTTSPEALDAALSCPQGVRGDRDPVLLVPGGTGDPITTFSAGLEPVLRAHDYPVCAVTLPEAAFGDVQIQAEYVVASIRRIAARSGRPVSVIAPSGGGPVSRWALKWWPDLRSLVGDVVGLAPANHGVGPVLQAFCDGPCPPAGRQGLPGSRFLAALNGGDETPGRLAYSVISSATDVNVLSSSSNLDGDANDSNTVIQTICPGRSVDHGHVNYDAVAIALALDALRHRGPARASRIGEATCAKTYADQIDPAEVERQMAAGIDYFVANYTRAGLTESEPELKRYPTRSAPEPRATLRIRAHRLRAGKRTVVSLLARGTARNQRWPIANARVQVARRSVATNKHGRASLRLRVRRPGKLRVRLVAPGLAPVTERLAVKRGRAPASQAKPAMAAAPVKPPSCTGKHWVGVWSASPSDADAQTSRSLAGQTARTVLTPLGTGKKLRVHLTNVLSAEPVTVGAASVAKSTGGASVKAKSLKRLRFDSDRSVTIPAGGQVVSDSVRVKVNALKRLAVSTYVDPSSAGLVTEHYLGRQNSYLASGNQVRDSGSSAYGETSLSRFIVAGVDVRAPRTLGAVAALGDSITDGFQGDVASGMQSQVGIDEDVRYPDFLARRLTTKHGDQKLTVLNAGISGNRVLRDGLIPRMGPSGLSRLDRDVIGLAGVRTVIVMEGLNDIGLPPNASADEVITGLQQLVERLKAARLRVLLGTLNPVGGFIYGDSTTNAIRTQVNDWIRTQKLSDGVVDFDAAVRDPADHSRLLPAFDSGDHGHPSTAGYKAMAAAVPLKRLGAGKCG